MVGPLRIDVAYGWCHVVSPGLERRPIFLDKPCNFHFLRKKGDSAGGFHYKVVSAQVCRTTREAEDRSRAKMSRKGVLGKIGVCRDVTTLSTKGQSHA